MIEDLRISNEHLVRHLAFCDEAQCFIFPWADGGDLGDFWQRECPRKLEDFLWSLKQMVGLAHALEDLHKLGDCRHGDLKPANILHFTEGGVGILKIADFGVSKVHHTKTTARNSATITSAFSRGYEGPEASTVYKDQNPAEPRSRRYDCWSMGCIILEFVIWLLYDFRALDSFGQFRDSPDPTYYHIASDTTIKNAVPQRILVVHPEVSKAMKCLRDDKRCKDKALESLVKLVGDNLLKISYKQRLESAELHEKLQVMLDKVKKNPSDLVNLGIGPPNPRPKIFDQPLSLRPTTKSTYDPSSSSEED
jgi:serine/threonine protein kinase